MALHRLPLMHAGLQETARAWVYNMALHTLPLIHAGLQETALAWVYNMTELPPANYELEVTLNKDLEDKFVFKRRFEIFSDPFSCGVFLTGKEGIKLEDGRLRVDFSVTGLFDDYLCLTNGSPTSCKLYIIHQI